MLSNGDFDKGVTIFLTNILDTATYIFGQLDSGQNIKVSYDEAGSGFPNPGPTYLGILISIQENR